VAKKKEKGGFPFISRIHFSLPEKAKRMIWSIALFAFALVFIFAFFDKAGTVGKLLFDISRFLVGKEVFLFPVFLVMVGVVLWSMKKYSAVLVFFTFLLLTGSTAGVLGTFARSREFDVAEWGGWIGSLVSIPIYAAFGFWVGEIVFLALIAIAGVIFWQLLPHEKMEGTAFAQGAQEKIKKIFEPKFDVSEVEPDDDDEEDEDDEEEDGEEDEEEDGEEDENEEDEDEKGSKKKGMRTRPVAKTYKAPPLDLLEIERGSPNAGDVKSYSAIIKKTLQNFDIPVEISEVNIGPAVTQYAFKPAEGVKLSRITALHNDLALALAAHPLRIEAPIPGRALVGIEIPNKTRATVRLQSLLSQKEFTDSSASLLLALGKDVSGSPIYTDLAKMPHMLVAGATGSGKTIGLNGIIMSLVYRNSPSQLRIILVDPKRVEFPVYNDLPHLLTPVIHDTQHTINALKWLIKEMERRFIIFSEVRVRDLKSYHALYESQKGRNKGEDMEEIPYIVTIIDELADLMASRGKDMEGMIVRLAQMARAVGIHLVLATQRPSVEVITGLIKANITARIAFQVASQIDSRTILDGAGAEKLLGQGDMLFLNAEFSKPRRIQGAYVSDKEVKKIVAWIGNEAEDTVQEDMGESKITQRAILGLEGESDDSDEEPLYEEARRVVIEAKKASASLLQRRLKVGYARAARLLDILEDKGIVGPLEGAKPREVYGSATNSEDDDGGENEEWLKP